MQIKQKKDTRKITITVVVVIAIILLGLGVYWFLTRDSNDVIGQPDQTTNGSGTPSVKTDDTDTNQTVDKTTDEVPTDTKGSLTIDSFTQKNGLVSVKATTSNFDTTKCVYTFTSDGGKPVVREQSGDCRAMSVSQEAFDMIGKYKLTVTAYSSDDKITATKEVTVE